MECDFCYKEMDAKDIMEVYLDPNFREICKKCAKAIFKAIIEKLIDKYID